MTLYVVGLHTVCIQARLPNSMTMFGLRRDLNSGDWSLRAADSARRAHLNIDWALDSPVSPLGHEKGGRLGSQSHSLWEPYTKTRPHFHTPYCHPHRCGSFTLPSFRSFWNSMIFSKGTCHLNESQRPEKPLLVSMSKQTQPQKQDAGKGLLHGPCSATLVLVFLLLVQSDFLNCPHSGCYL